MDYKAEFRTFVVRQLHNREIGPQEETLHFTVTALVNHQLLGKGIDRVPQFLSKCGMAGVTARLGEYQLLGHLTRPVNNKRDLACLLSSAPALTTIEDREGGFKAVAVTMSVQARTEALELLSDRASRIGIRRLFWAAAVTAINSKIRATPKLSQALAAYSDLPPELDERTPAERQIDAGYRGRRSMSPAEFDAFQAKFQQSEKVYTEIRRRRAAGQLV